MCVKSNILMLYDYFTDNVTVPVFPFICFADL